MQMLMRRAGELELAARLERDRGDALLQGDDIVAFVDALPTVFVGELVQERADAALAFVGNRFERIVVKGELLVVGANAPSRAVGLRAFLEMRDEIAKALKQGRFFLGIGHERPPSTGISRGCGGFG